ncbi:Inner membrane ABC transporter permease protein YejE [Anatilimnocola aggregata]|uniref:Inner membrane ABC transporter permease protein YejE n=1 Tax=Anatilimnocola aggregata TaxID=2528021 RepID=A0A517YNN6_9BACT|nr:ABC transporter permease [Anatilimnocola aggregata]QDU31827.1 Inner membrane ABC transporter permease protein YejE [Anatilimnocola aggregata]
MASDLKSTPASNLPGQPVATPQPTRRQRSRGFAADAWHRFSRRPLAMIAVVYVILLSLIAVFSPAIAGTRPVICQYKGKIYFPALYYFNRKFENPVFFRDQFYGRYYYNLKEKDPNSWAVWPLVYQDPLRWVDANEFPGVPANPTGDNGKPSRFNLMGTTELGIDVFAQMVHGTKIALLVGFVATGVAAAIGITLGGLAGYIGGGVDFVISRFTEIVMCVPSLIVILALLAIVDQPSIWYTMIIIGLTSWPSICRLTRAEFLKLRAVEYVTAARALGASTPRIIFLHILPNAMAPVLVPISFGIASAILLEAGLSILGIGAPPDTPSWGTVLNLGRSNLQTMWWMTTFPGAAIFLTVLAYNLIGEGLQEATDPRLVESKK